ncbi:MAG: alkaline phosphatase D family protein [Hydrogenophilaceae bacterium]|jgi:alkaline phosphatase D|nr:alkaline phosphatase D family protein [Hydrogenophilaceae bacterium]
MTLSRRSLLIAASLAAAPVPAVAQGSPQGRFTHGVASGDPLETAVILWTRFAPADGGDAELRFEVSEREDFSRIARRGRAVARAANDYCAKVDVRGLRPGRSYYYRFLSGAGPSPTGMTKTAPRGAAARLSFAFFSCSNKPFGYFHAYGHAAARADIDIALHLGDYIYEYARGVYPAADVALADRVIEPAGEIVTYADYCARYASYHDDIDLQELRRLKPMSVIWDDHELANNAYRTGAQNHQEGAEGAWTDRVAAAAKAFFDWMPIRRPDPGSARIYRSLDWGDLARIILLDTRLIGRPQEFSYDALAAAAAEGPEAALAAAQAFRAQLTNPALSRLGAAQEAWFEAEVAGSKARGHAWQVIAQQVVMGEQIAPAGLSRLLGEDASPGTRRYVTGGEQIGALGLPWNLDSWGGYPAARARLLEACVAHGTNAIVLSGDSHNCWVNNLAAAGGGRNAAIEFAGGSVSSFGFESALTNAQPGEREAIMRGGNPGMAWCDVTRRGYGAVTLTREACAAEWVAFENVRDAAASSVTVTTLTSAASANGPSDWAVG